MNNPRIRLHLPPVCSKNKSAPEISIGRRAAWAVICLLGLALFVIPYSETFADDSPGSTYVPMDSWVYAAFDRLAGLGVINKQFVGLRPWTRLQCAQLVLDAEDNMESGATGNNNAQSLFEALDQEFSLEVEALNGTSPPQAEVESVYTRALGISGTPLRDGDHFGQTLTDDFGRPFNTGFNNVSGFSAHAIRGRFFAYVRGEYQYSPAYAGLTPSQQAFIANLDGTPVAINSQATPATDRFDLLDTYVGMRISIYDVTFGKQSLWWGPGTLGPMLGSDNVDPILMLRINQVQPIVLPGFLSFMGPVRVQAYFGRLSGNEYPRGPYVHGEKALLKPTRNLEIGFSRSTEAFGQGIPFTFHNLFATYFSTTDICCTANPQDFPGKRQSGMDMSYRLPFVRKWATIYTDDLSEDDLSPLVNPGRAMYNPGLYLSQLPHLQKFDFRVELATTGQQHEQAYASFFYHPAFFNKGFLMGNAVGRWGKTFDTSTTYWYTPRQRLEIEWDEHRVAKELIPKGGAQDSVRIKADWLVHKDMEISALAQHERWSFQFLANGKQSDNVFSLQISFYPKNLQLRTALKSFD